MKRGQMLTELRRSHASGVHDHVSTRSELRREAITMSMLDLDYPDDTPVDEDREPTAKELDDIALEEEAGLYGDDRYVDLGDEEEYSTGDPYDNEYDR